MNVLKAFLLLILVLFCAPGKGFTQEAAPTQNAAPNIFEAQLRAADAVTLLAGQTRILLWGIDPVSGMGAAFDLKARTALANALGNNKAQCEVKNRDAAAIHAQCVNGNDLDLSLFMLQQGYVTADRSAVLGSVFEDAYIQAEMEAQDKGLGVWTEKESSGGSNAGDGTLMISFGFILFMCIIGAFTVLSIIIMRGFQKVIDAQNQNVEMMSRERKLRDKERGVVSTMLDSELKGNKAKIEAYLVVYEEMLKSLKDPDRPPKYKKSGDIVQKQPALDRSVFDRNTDKLDTLGGDLSSAVIHFYARIKSNPEYENLEPDAELAQVIATVEEVVKKAQRLNKLAQNLIDAFGNSGINAQMPED
jgi:endonuclease YncB( thermonuclease family)